MVRGGGSVKGRSTRSSRSAGVTDAPALRGEECLCGTCGDDVGANPIGCDKCDHWVHGTQMCSGLPLDLINAILKYDGGGIQFICMKCRVEQVTARGNSPSGHTDPQLADTVKQLHMQVKGMCSVIKELTAQVKALSSKPQPLTHDAAAATTPAPPPVQPPAQQEYRELIREELKEQKEREKRRCFLVVKGLSATSTTDFRTKFEHLTSTFLETSVEVSEVMSISSQSNFFRVKIPDDTSRRLLLDKAKHLKGSEHQNVYISRDLTYAQRTELYRRRQARQAREPDAVRSATGARGPPARAPEVAATTAVPGDCPPHDAGATGHPDRPAPQAGN